MSLNLFGLPRIPETGWKTPLSFPRLDAAKMICIDLETYDPELLTHGPGWGRGVGHIVGVAVGTDDGKRWYFPMRHTTGTGNLPPDVVLQWCRDEFNRPNQPKVFANAQYDLGWLAQEGVTVAGDIIDVQIAEPLLDEHAHSYSLDTLAEKYLGVGKTDDALYDWCYRAYGGKPGRPQAGNIWRAPPALVGPYAEGDVDLPLRIWEKQRPLLEEQGLMGIFQVESRLPQIFVGMRMKGARVNVAKAEQISADLAQKTNHAVSRIKSLTGSVIDIWAADSIALALNKAAIEYPKTGTGRPSFTAGWLSHHPSEAIQLIQLARKYDKARSTFIQGYILDKQVNGRLYGQFHQLRGDEGGTIVGRLSSSLPNLENIPARDPDIGPLIRSIYEPEEGCQWGTMDYSQIQFRIMVHYAMGKGADEARQRYNADPKTDYHNMAQALIREVTGQDLNRKTVKGINFGLCIAEGQLVLTDHGLVPIENVTTTHKVWDGVEWVPHDGVIYKGHQNVITYAGLTATPDHRVYTEGHCNPVPFWSAASKSNPKRLARGENNGQPVAYPKVERDAPSRGKSTHFLFTLRGRPLDMVVYAVKAIAKVFLPFQTTPTSTRSSPFARSLEGHEIPLREYIRQRFSQLRGTRDSVVFYAVRFCGLLLNAISWGQLQGATNRPNRPNRQQWSLCTGKYSICDTTGKLTKYAALRIHTIPRSSISYTGRSSRNAITELPASREMESKFTGSGAAGKLVGGTDCHQTMPGAVPVYDILNAGPRHRFTVSGVVVSNCFTMGVNKLADELGMSVEEATPLIDAYHEGIPFVRATSDAIAAVAQKRGHIVGILGRRHRFPFWEPKEWNLRSKVKMSIDEDAVRAAITAEKGKPGSIVRAFTHLGLNRLAQDGEGSMMKKALVDCHASGLFDILGYPINIVHDDISLNVPPTKEGETALKEVIHIMQTAIPAWKVPILVESSCGENWGSCK